MVQDGENSNRSSDETTSVGIVEGVQQTLKQLVEHFNQPVHDDILGTGGRGGLNDNDGENNKDDFPPPYFDPVLGRKPELSSTVRFWLDRLLSITASTTQPDSETTAIGIVEWIFGYESSIRPLLLQSAVGCVPMLEQYELILSEWLHQIAQHKKSKRISPEETRGETLELVEPTNRDSLTSTVPTIIISLSQHLSRTIEILATDITLTTSERYFPKVSVYVRCNIILPTLLRILDRTLETLHIVSGLGNGSIVPVHFQNAGSGNSHYSNCLRRCVVSLLAFDGMHIAPPDVAPTLADGLPRGGIGSVCYYPPTNIQQNEIQVLDRKYLSLDSIDWDPVTLSTSGWSDPTTGIVARAVGSVWSQLTLLLLGEKCESGIQQSEDDRTTNDANNTDHLHQRRRRRQAIIRLLGIRPLLHDVRKHFFGRDMIAWEPQLHISQQVVLGRRVTKSRPVVDEKPYQAIPSRVAVALNFLRLLNRTDDHDHDHDDDGSITEWSYQDIIDNLFPICATLLDSTSATFVALGASGMLEVMNFLDGALADFSDGSDHLRGGSDSETSSWKTFVDDGLAALERAFQASHEGPVMVAIGQAQSRLLQILQFRKYSQWDNRRRRITGQWLFRLQRTSHRPATTSQCWELLFAGIVPLLLQHARNETTSADSMEMGRMGLSALLPLIGGEYHVDDKALVLAVVALINLLGGAYPIMPNHGGKILCHLLAAIATISDIGMESSIRRKLVAHTAGVAITICGPKFTATILDDIINNNRDEYQETLIEAAIQAREQAKNLQHGYVGNVQ